MIQIASTSRQSVHSLHCLLEESFAPWLSSVYQVKTDQTADTQISLRLVHIRNTFIYNRDQVSCISQKRTLVYMCQLVGLKGKIHLVDFCYKGDNCCYFLFALLHIKIISKRVYSQRKEFAPHGSKFFPFRVDLFGMELK